MCTPGNLSLESPDDLWTEMLQLIAEVQQHAELWDADNPDFSLAFLDSIALTKVFSTTLRGAR